MLYRDQFDCADSWYYIEGQQSNSMGAKTKVRDEDLRAAWEAGETVRSIEARLKVTDLIIRRRWVALYGEEAVVLRAKQNRYAAGSRMGKSATGKVKVYGVLDCQCFKCQSPMQRTTFQVGKTAPSNLLCDQCQRDKDGDRDCPACGLRIDGWKGLSKHAKHQVSLKDTSHSLYDWEALWGIYRAEVEATKRVIMADHCKDLQEPVDFVTCRECGKQGLNLGGHIQHAHGLTAEQYHAQHGQDVWLCCFRSTEATEIAIAKKYPAGRSHKIVEITCPDCGVTRDGTLMLAKVGTHLQCDQCATLEAAAKDNARWEGKSEPADFLTCRVCGTFRGENLSAHIAYKHPEVSGRYVDIYGNAPLMTDRAAESHGVPVFDIAPADLEPFMDEKGRVEVSRAAKHFGCCHWTVLIRCREQNIPTRNSLAFQKWVLDCVSKELGNSGYVWEWTHADIRGRGLKKPLRFDGYFAGHNLLVEAHGRQHFEFNRFWHKTQEEFERRMDTDIQKRQRANALGFKVLEIRYDEPFTNPAYLAGRLVQMGVLQPGTGAATRQDGDSVFDLFG